jgi:prepilin-type N-terminal cleavage/methylation domain-containing protein
MKTRGFTLIELLVVLVAIAIATTIFYQLGYGHSTEHARAGHFECKGGFTFKVEENGDARPATNTEVAQAKC